MSTTQKPEEIESEPEDEIEESEVGESEVGESDVDLAEYEEGEEVGDVDGMMLELLGSTLTTPEGDTICSVLSNINRQLEIHNKILVKLLATLQKN